MKSNKFNINNIVVKKSTLNYNIYEFLNNRYLYYILSRNQTITENNKSVIVEAFRSMSEILIWGDQNDSSVFEYVLIFLLISK